MFNPHPYQISYSWLNTQCILGFELFNKKNYLFIDLHDLNINLTCIYTNHVFMKRILRCVVEKSNGIHIIFFDFTKLS